MLDACSLDIAKPLTARDPPYLATLNAQQRVAVEHGVGVDADDRRPLLIIAGAGSGKTSTLACRAAHLIANGADAQRLLLLTFSRRAAEAHGGALRPDAPLLRHQVDAMKPTGRVSGGKDRSGHPLSATEFTPSEPGPPGGRLDR